MFFFFLSALADAGREVPVVQGRGMAQGGAVVLQRHDQPGRRGAGRADRQGPTPDRVQPVLRIVRAREPGAAQAGAAGLRPVEQGGRLLSGVQHAGRAHTASDGEERVRRPKGLGVVPTSSCACCPRHDLSCPHSRPIHASQQFLYLYFIFVRGHTWGA